MNLDKNEIVDWAMYYATYDELEMVAKTIYRIYKHERTKNYPEDDRKQKEIHEALQLLKKKKTRKKKQQHKREQKMLKKWGAL